MLKKEKNNNNKVEVFGGCLVGNGRGKRGSGVWVFSPEVLKKVFSTKWGERGKGGLAHGLCSICCFFFFFHSSFSVFFVPIFCLFVLFINK